MPLQIVGFRGHKKKTYAVLSGTHTLGLTWVANNLFFIGWDANLAALKSIRCFEYGR